MAISNELLEMIRCPQTGQSLQLADTAVLRRVNQSIEQGGLRNKLDRVIEQKLDAGLICQDGSWLYPIIDDIPILLSDEAIALDILDAEDKPGEHDKPQD